LKDLKKESQDLSEDLADEISKEISEDSSNETVVPLKSSDDGATKPNLKTKPKTQDDSE
jgi:hypothetical protein